MAQQLRTASGLPEDLGSGPSTHMAAHSSWNSSFRGSGLSSDLPRVLQALGAQIYTQEHTHTREIK